MLISDLEGSLLSLSSAHQSLQISSQSLVPNSDQETTQDEVIPDQATHDDHHKNETEVPPNINANNDETISYCEKIKVEYDPKEVTKVYCWQTSYLYNVGKYRTS